MRKQLVVALCAACLAVGAQAQTSTDPSSSSGSTSSSSGSQGYSGSQSGWTGGHMGRMGHAEIRASQLTGAQITVTSGSEIGTISDLIVNPGSGRLDFAVVSLSSSTGGGTGSSGAATSPSGSSSSSGTSSGLSDLSSGSSQGGSSSVGGSSLGSSSASTAGKQVAVPWMLLRSSKPSTSGTSASSTTGQQPSFVFTGDAHKLQSAPTFDANTDLSQPSWRPSVFSYFGLSAGGAATGGAESPGGTSGSSSSPDSSSSSGAPK